MKLFAVITMRRSFPGTDRGEDAPPHASIRVRTLPAEMGIGHALDFDPHYGRSGTESTA